MLNQSDKKGWKMAAGIMQMMFDSMLIDNDDGDDEESKNENQIH